MRFDCLEASYQLIRELREAVGLVQRRDRKLHDQLTRALTSVSLNLAEGRGRHGQDRRQHWRIARGSAEEVSAALNVAEAFGYVAADDWGCARETLFRVHQMLWRLTR